MAVAAPRRQRSQVGSAIVASRPVGAEDSVLVPLPLRRGAKGEVSLRHLRYLTVFWLAIFALAGLPRAAFAHGEAADEPFLKDLTVAFYDAHISPTSVKVGEPVTITGKLTVLDTWPYTLDPPHTAYITPVVPGPVFALTDRVVNGDPDFGSILVEKGGTYEYSMTMLGRDPGRWHVHPGIAIPANG
jgi:methane/ammonia monooxygenase subunit B